MISDDATSPECRVSVLFSTTRRMTLCVLREENKETTSCLPMLLPVTRVITTGFHLVAYGRFIRFLNRRRSVQKDVSWVSERGHPNHHGARSPPPSSRAIAKSDEFLPEPQSSICGNGVVEDSEECDCGWEDECKETCCVPQTGRTNSDDVPCTLKKGVVCSPSQVSSHYNVDGLIYVHVARIRG